MGRARVDDNQHTIRQHERDDCVRYGACLNEAAHGRGRNRGGFDSLPNHSAWQKRGDWEPTGLG